jgi:ZIP family zinc transporter
MSFGMTVVLGAVAGFTILLGLPIARLKNPPPVLRAFLNSLATGILLFLLWDILSKAIEPVETSMAQARSGGPAGDFITLLLVCALGFGLGLLSLVYFENRFIRRTAEETRTHGATPAQLSLMIAIGIGLHNFSEGLAIGQSSHTGEISLATTLIIGFGLHNLTEGFGIAAPLTAGQRPSWVYLGLLGLIGGGPTFVGTLLGFAGKSQWIYVFCLALAAGSIFYVISELLNVGRSFKLREIAMWGIFLGFLAGLVTDLVLTWAGA